MESHTPTIFGTTTIYGKHLNFICYIIAMVVVRNSWMRFIHGWSSKEEMA